jgi:hypothetical protein
MHVLLGAESRSAWTRIPLGVSASRPYPSLYVFVSRAGPVETKLEPKRITHRAMPIF